MTREEAAKLLPIIKAYSEGKIIEVKFSDGTWHELTDVPQFDSSPQDYRIKPKPAYRPYYNIKECFHDMKNHEPFGYIRKKNTDNIDLIVGALDDEYGYLRLSVAHKCSKFNTVFDNYTYLDGQPFGIRKEG